MTPTDWLYMAFLANIALWLVWEWLFPRHKTKTAPSPAAKPAKTDLDAIMRIANLMQASRRRASLKE